jgi:hypothetical protein
MQLVADVTLTANATSISVSSIPQDGSRLLIMVQARTTVAARVNTIRLRWNNLSTGWFQTTLKHATTASAVYFNNRNGVEFPTLGASSPGGLSIANISIGNYSRTNIGKSATVTATAPDNQSPPALESDVTIGRNSNTAAVSSFQVIAPSANLAAGTRVMVFKQ